MSVSNSSYIQTIDRSSASPSANEVFNVTIGYSGAVDILVWMKSTAGVYTQKHSGTDFEVFESTIRWIGTPPACAEIRIQRNLAYDQQATQSLTTADNLEKCLDRVCETAQQQLQYNTLSPKNLDAKGDKISNVKSPPVDGDVYAVTKADVDAAFGSDTSTHWSTSSGDVGKYAKHLGSVTGGIQEWVDINGHPDHRGQEFKHLTAAGWEKFGNIPAVGSGNNSKILKDVDGVETWTSANEFPSGGTFGQILHRDNDEDPDAAEWRNSGYTPTPLSGKIYKTVKAADDGTNNQWRGKFFLTQHLVEFDNDLGNSGVANTEWTGPIGFVNVDPQHRVWVGTISHIHGTPSFIYPQVAWHNAKLFYKEKIGTSGSFGYHCAIWDQVMPFLVNVVSISDGSIELALGSLLHSAHDGLRVVDASTTSNGNHFPYTAATPSNSEIVTPQLATNISVPINIMWYFEE